MSRCTATVSLASHLSETGCLVDNRPMSDDANTVPANPDSGDQPAEAADHAVPQGAIVVGVDGSEQAQRALAWAVTDAARRSRPLHLLCARESYIGAAHLDSAVEWSDPSLEALDSSKEVTDRAVEYVHSIAPDLPVTVSRPWGRPAQHLVIASREAELVVVGSRGHGGLSAVVMGTVSLQTAAHARCPVVVVRDGHPEHPGGPLRITVGVDGSHDSTQAVQFAMRMAGAGGSVTLVLAWWLEVVNGMVVTTPESEGWKTVTAKHEATLEKSLGSARQEHPDVQVHTRIERGRTEEVLLDAVQGSDLTVVGSRGRGGFSGLLLGSVSQHMLTAAPCPVAVMVNRRDG